MRSRRTGPSSARAATPTRTRWRSRRRRPSCARSPTRFATSPSSAGTSSTSRASRTRGPSGAATSRTATRPRSRPGTTGSAKRYGDAEALAAAWGVAPGASCPLSAACPLPAPADLSLTPATGTRGRCAPSTTTSSRRTRSALGRRRWWTRSARPGSRQLVAVGQDEGGVGDRLLNQFYGGGRRPHLDAQLVERRRAALGRASPRSGRACRTSSGETGPQPAVAHGRTLAVGRDAGPRASSSASWRSGWPRATPAPPPGSGRASDPYHIGRPDGSSTLWLEAAHGVAASRRRPRPTSPTPARARSRSSCRSRSSSRSSAHYGRRGAAEMRARPLPPRARLGRTSSASTRSSCSGSPRLILLPSPWVLSERAWDEILERSRGGATLLVTRPLRPRRALPADRAAARRRARLRAGDPRRRASTPCAGRAAAGARSSRATRRRTSSRRGCPAARPSRAAPLGQGQVLFFPLPLELNDDLRLLGDVYAWALAEAGVEPALSHDARRPRHPDLPHRRSRRAPSTSSPPSPRSRARSRCATPRAAGTCAWTSIPAAPRSSW